MNRMIFALVSTVAALCILTGNALAAEKYLVKFKIVEVQEDFDASDLAIHVHPHLDKKKSLLTLRVKGVHSFTNLKCSQCHSTANGKDSDDRLFLQTVLDRKDLLSTWDNNSQHVKVLATPPIIKVDPARLETVNMKSSRELQYFRKLQNGHFAIQSENVTTGVVLKFAVEDAGDNHIRLRSFSVSVTAVKGREKIDGVKLPIGKPIISTTSIDTSIKSKLGQSSVISIDSPRGGRVLISVKVTRPAKK